MVVSIAKNRRSYGYDVAQNSLGWIASTIDLWVDPFNDDSLTAFDRFHITQIFRLAFVPIVVRQAALKNTDIGTNKDSCIRRCRLSRICLLAGGTRGRIAQSSRLIVEAGEAQPRGCRRRDFSSGISRPKSSQPPSQDHIDAFVRAASNRDCWPDSPVETLSASARRGNSLPAGN